MKSRRFLSVLVAVCLLVSSMAVVAFAADGEFVCSNVSFGYISGNAWTDATGLEAGKDLSAKISVSKSGEAESVIFSLIVYNEDKIYDVSTVTQEVSTETVLTATASLPDNADDCYVSAFLWDNYVDMTPICNISGFPDASVAVTGISVDGVAIQNFDPAVKTYEVAVSADKKLKPVVEVTTLDLGARVTVTDPTGFPGSSVIKVTNGSGDENTYTINYTFAEALVSNIDYTANVYENITEAMIIPAVYSDFQVGSKAYYDRAFVVTDVTDESYLGMDYIGAGLGWKNSPPYRDYYGTKPSEWWQFTMERGGQVKIVTQSAITALTDMGYEEADVANLITVDVNGSPYVHDVVYTKSCEKGEQVVLPSMFATTGLFVFFEFDGYEEPAVPGAELTGIEIETAPAKLNYIAGDELDLTGLKVNAVYSNGEKAAIDDYEVSSCDMTAGTHTITVSYEGFTATFDIIVEAVTFGLASLSVDGTPVAGFDIAANEYTVTIPAAQASFPVVEAVATEGGTAEVTNPTEFPGKATVTVTKDGEEDKVYTINYVVAEELVSGITILEDNTIPETYGGGNVYLNATYTKGGFKEDAFVYADRTDRTYPQYRIQIGTITATDLIGADYITGGVTWYQTLSNKLNESTTKAFTSSDVLPWLNFTVARDAAVYVFENGDKAPQKFEQYGYTQSVSEDATNGYFATMLNDGKLRPMLYMYSKSVSAGDKVTVPNYAGGAVYSVVVKYKNYAELETEEPAPEPEAALGLASLSVDGTAVADFDIDTLGYEVTIPANQKSVPLVDAIATYNEATVDVVNPDTFPGEAVVTVSMDGKEDVVYTITYVLDKEIISDIDYGTEPKAVSGHNDKYIPVMYSNFDVDATPAMYDRNGVLHNSNSSVTAVGDEGFIGLDYFGVGFGWRNSPPYRDLYNAGTYISDWWHFTVNREAEITVLSMVNSGDYCDDLLAQGFVMDETKADYAKILVGTSNNYTYSYKYTKTVNAGDKITFGNTTGTGYFVLIDYDGYTE